MRSFKAAQAVTHRPLERVQSLKTITTRTIRFSRRRMPCTIHPPLSNNSNNSSPLSSTSKFSSSICLSSRSSQCQFLYLNHRRSNISPQLHKKGSGTTTLLTRRRLRSSVKFIRSLKLKFSTIPGYKNSIRSTIPPYKCRVPGSRTYDPFIIH